MLKGSEFFCKNAKCDAVEGVISGEKNRGRDD
jgi:hypothetical protein